MSTLAEQIRDVKAEIDCAVIQLDALATHRTELAACARRLQDMLGELTPVRPPSHADMRAVRIAVEAYADGKR